MDPTVRGGRLASAAIGPLVRKLLAADGPGAGLVDRPVRRSALVSFRGEKLTLGEKDVRRLPALGDLEMDDVQAVRLGHREPARELLRSADACHFLDSATQWSRAGRRPN